MALQRQLDSWREAGLISEGQVAAILAHEQGRQRPWLLYSVAGLGGLAISVGILALVAANWAAIGPQLKLGLDLLVGLGLAWGLWRAVGRGQPLAREVLLLLVYGWTLASIALVAQVYQLGGATWEALLTWSVLTAPILTFTEGRFTALAWLLGLNATYGFVVVENLQHRIADEWSAGLLGFPVPVLLLLASSPALQARAQAVTRAAATLGRVLLFSCFAAAPQLFYLKLHAGDPQRSVPLVVSTGVEAALLVLAAPRLARLLMADRREPPPLVAHLCRALPIALWLVVVLALEVEHGASGPAAALAFVVLWGGVAALGAAARLPRLINLATGLIALRVLVIYLEVFGSLADTGLGLIGGGLLALGLAWAWTRSRKRVTEVSGAASPAPSAGGEAGR